MTCGTTIGGSWTRFSSARTTSMSLWRGCARRVGSPKHTETSSIDFGPSVSGNIRCKRSGGRGRLQHLLPRVRRPALRIEEHRGRPRRQLSERGRGRPHPLMTSVQRPALGLQEHCGRLQLQEHRGRPRPLVSSLSHVQHARHHPLRQRAQAGSECIRVTFVVGCHGHASAILHVDRSSWHTSCRVQRPQLLE